jgi:catechol 2,3-dioxygenase-like lactoylglutathione lyase family enzyme
MKVNKLAFSGIPVTQMKRARAFYEGVLGLEVAEEMMDGNWIEYDLASVGESWTPSDQGTAAGLEVENFDAAIQKLKVSVIVSRRRNHSRRPAVTSRWCRIRMGTK